VGIESSNALHQEATPKKNLTAKTKHPTHILKILRVAKCVAFSFSITVTVT
jgi:hypothetical protein